METQLVEKVGKSNLVSPKSLIKAMCFFVPKSPRRILLSWTLKSSVVNRSWLKRGAILWPRTNCTLEVNDRWLWETTSFLTMFSGITIVISGNLGYSLTSFSSAEFLLLWPQNWQYKHAQFSLWQTMLSWFACSTSEVILLILQFLSSFHLLQCHQ